MLYKLFFLDLDVVKLKEHFKLRCSERNSRCEGNFVIENSANVTFARSISVRLPNLWNMLPLLAKIEKGSIDGFRKRVYAEYLRLRNIELY